MKSLIKLSVVALALLVATGSFSFAQDRGNKKARPSPNASISQTIGTTVVSITYGRPGLKGRKLEDLVPANKVWRTGANESTAITFSDDVMIGDKAISAGTYSLYSMGNEDTAYLIINSKLSWGTQYDESMDVARIQVPVSSDNPHVEWFTISFDTLSDTQAHLNLSWGATVVSVPITVK